MGCGQSREQAVLPGDPPKAVPLVDQEPAKPQAPPVEVPTKDVAPHRPAPSPPSASHRSILGKPFVDIGTDYELGRVLGRGQFGVTRVAVRRADGARFACKSIAKRKLRTPEDEGDVRREVEIMHHLKGHAHVTYLAATYEDRVDVHIVMDLCTGGELFDRITARGYYSEADAAAAVRSIVGVVAYCHSLHVMHRDLKPENFLLASAAPDAPLKCTDFGLSTFFKPGERFRDLVGSAYYMAPEVLRRSYGPEADLWSCGVILYILLSGMPPFYGGSEREIFDRILAGHVDFETAPWPSISPEAKDCVARLLQREPRRRAKAADILRHPWLREHGVASDRRLDDAIINRLGTFATHNKLKREAMRVIATGMPAEEIAGLKAVFESVDADGSGTITAEELRDALRSKGAVLRPEDLQTLVQLIDTDATGTIDYDEFLAATLSQHQLMREDHMLRAFRHFDADDSGTISREELKLALGRGGLASEAEIDAILEEVDKDKSGTIDYAEFCDMMSRSHESALKVAPRRAQR